MSKSSLSTRKLTALALMLAISIVFNFIPGFSTLPVVSFIKYEFSDIPILITAFAFGAVPGAAVAVLAVWISFFLGGESGGPWGALMHMIAIGVYIIPAAVIYNIGKKRAKTALSAQFAALVSMVCGVVAMTAVMIPANILITPIYTGAPRSAVTALLLPGIIPVNAIKGAITAIITYLLYPYISPLLHGRRYSASPNE